jgi:hypothetical protein
MPIGDRDRLDDRPGSDCHGPPTPIGVEAQPAPPSREFAQRGTRCRGLASAMTPSHARPTFLVDP